jgi:hypothetical protein
MIFKPDDETLDTFVQSLDRQGLNHILSKILTELRVREKEDLRLDFITKSRRLLMGEARAIPPGSKVGEEL